MLTGLVIGLVGLACDDALLSRGLLVCSPEERAAFAEVEWPGGSKLEPQPQVSTGRCAASLAAPGPPMRASSRLSERLKAAGWRVRSRTAGDGAFRAEGVLLTATKARFYCEVVYFAPGSGSSGRSGARVQIQLGKV